MLGRAKNTRAPWQGITFTRDMDILKILLLGLFLSGCFSKATVLINENAMVSELSGLDRCNFNYQCKRIGIGYAFCSHIEEGTAGTLHYSTLIGKENINRLKVMVAKEIAEEEARIQKYLSDPDNPPECQPYWRSAPDPVCSNNRCITK